MKTAKNGRKRLPVGLEDFKEIRSDRFYYVDKTGLIKELLDGWGKVNLFTRPRRFGKTLNMSMFQNFFEIGCDKSLFDGLEIARDAGLCEKYMGKYPVISISLKSVEADTYEEARQMAVCVINEEARRFRYLLESDQLFQDEKDLYSALLKKEMSMDTLVCSLRELSELLRKHHGKNVIILIDEYDVPLAKAEQQGYYDEMLLLIRGMLQQALKTNRNLHFAVMTGCLRVSKESIFTGLNNLRVLSITNVRFDEYFGFTDAEVRELLEYYGLSEKYDTIRAWYDGYRFGNEKVYCPWDVISYCDDLMADPMAEPKAYWSNTSSNEVVRRLLDKARPDMRDDIERLIAGEIVVKEISEDLTYRELYEKADHVWSALFSTGYLTQQERATGNMFPLVIPNREIHSIFIAQIRDWMQIKAREDSARLDAFCEAFRMADAETVQSIFEAYLIETISIRDTAVRQDLKENFYHGFLLGLLRSRGNWKVVSNREGGLGFTDIVIEIFEEKLGIVIEVKYPENGDLEAGCRSAIRQINEKKYTDQPRMDGMIRILKCGMACYRKNCKVVFETV